MKMTTSGETNDESFAKTQIILFRWKLWFNIIDYIIVLLLYVVEKGSFSREIQTIGRYHYKKDISGKRV